MFTFVLKGKLYFHRFMQRHHESLMKDALCEKLKQQLKSKANYHAYKSALIVSLLIIN